MIDSLTRITLNLQETNTMVTVKAKKSDTGRILQIYLADGNVPYHISDDCYAAFTAQKPDGTKIHNPCTIENNVIEYEFTEQTCASVGTLTAEIKIYGADRKMITSASFLIVVCDTVFTDGDEVSSEEEMNTLDDLILRATELLNQSGNGNQDKPSDPEAPGNPDSECQCNGYVYVLADGETLDDSPDEAYLVVDPNANPADVEIPSGGSSAPEIPSTGNDQAVFTHKWDGTVLTITSSSGTSSADLKGEKGDSIKGDPGADGVSPTVAVSKSGKVTTVSITDKSGTKTATINDGVDGSPGKDGTSVTHSWNGTTLTVTSASGTSSANLKGDKGDPGATPEKGKDYFTDADKQEIAAVVKSLLPKYIPAVLTSEFYGDELPPAGTPGRIFFKRVVE